MNRRKELLFMLPGLAGFGLFYLFPLILTCYYVFIRSPFDSTFVGVENVMKTIQNQYFQIALGHTATFTLISVTLTLVSAVFLTFLLSDCRFSFHTPFMLPVLLPTVAVVLVWNVLFGHGSVLYQIGIDPKTSLYTLFIWKNTGLYVIFMLSSLSQLSRETVEAAAIDGAGAVRRFWYIILPHLLPTLFFCCVYAIMCSFRIFREAYLLYGAYPDEPLFMVQHFIYNQFTKLHYPEVASAGFLYAIPIIFLVALIFRAQNGLRKAA